MEVEQRSKFLSIIVKESERLTRLINQVLDMAKIDSGRIDWSIGEVDLRGLIHDAINSTSQLFNDKGATLHEDLGDGEVIIAGDHDRLTQVLINLLSNAVKFCPEQGGEVAIRLRAVADRWRIEVIDNGPGIARDQHKLIFEKFHQVNDAHAGKPKGTGLGLPISQRSSSTTAAISGWKASSAKARRLSWNCLGRRKAKQGKRGPAAAVASTQRAGLNSVCPASMQGDGRRAMTQAGGKFRRRLAGPRESRHPDDAQWARTPTAPPPNGRWRRGSACRCNRPQLGLLVVQRKP